MNIVLPLSLLVVLFGGCEATFTDHFRGFLRLIYGNETEESLSRLDLGAGGSFGGSATGGFVPSQVKHRPVVFVHGGGGSAGGIRVDRVTYWINNSFTDVELYATTYDTGASNPNITTKCEHVIRIRRIIQAVSLYTLSTVNVMSYSFGVDIARKAVMGGRCVDTHQWVGLPLTALVHNFVGLSGCVYGFYACSLPNPNPGQVCLDRIVGADCHSAFIEDANSRAGYEAYHKVYSMYSTGDVTVGYKVCAENYTASDMAGSTSVVYNGLTHPQMLVNTVDMQFNLTSIQ